MKLVNETGQRVSYWIQSAKGGANCGEIDVDGLADHPEYDNQTDVYVGFNTTGAQQSFSITCDQTGEGEQVEMEFVAE
jgi:hypothetical protein